MQDPEKYKGITFLSQLLKLLEQAFERRLRLQIGHEIGKEQQSFKKGRSTSDGMFVVRQKIDNTIERKENMAIGFIDLEKASDIVPRTLLIAIFRWLNAEENDIQ